MTRWALDLVRRAHPEDQAYLDTLAWRSGRCHFCREDQPQVTEFDHVEQGTLPGYPLLICVQHAAHDLTLSRTEAANRGEQGYQPDIRRRR